MKISSVLFSFIFMVLFAIPIYSQEWTRSTKYINGYKFTTKITKEELQNLPTFNPETEDAPLSVHEAVVIARKNFKRLFPKLNEVWSLEKVNLERMGKNSWYYSIDFTDLTDRDITELDTSFTIFVKMDGTIAEPEIEVNDGEIRVY